MKLLIVVLALASIASAVRVCACGAASCTTCLDYDPACSMKFDPCTGESLGYITYDGSSTSGTITLWGVDSTCAGGNSVSISISTSCTSYNDFHARLEGGGGSCFSAGDMVHLVNGTRKSVSDVEVGDSVLSVAADRSLVADKVFRITKSEPHTRRTFLRFTTDSGNSLDLTAGHFIHVNDVNLETMKRADEIKVGDFLFVADHNDTTRVRPSAVKTITEVSLDGIFNFHTKSGTVLVNGIAASHFTDESTWKYRSAALWWYSFLDSIPHSVRHLVDGPVDVRKSASKTL